jgi:uncharacterized membrane protein YidH (DUF202 family)
MSPNGNNDYQYGQPPMSYDRPKSSKPTIAGVLLILASILGLITAVGMIYLSTLDSEDVEDTLLSSDEGELFGSVEGVVSYALNGSAAPDTSVSLKGEDLNTTTDSNGYYILEDIESGRHTLIVRKEGYNTIVREFLIASDEPELTYDFELEEGTNQTTIDSDQESVEMMNEFLLTCGVLFLIFSILTFIGAYYSITRTNYWMAKLGAVFGILAIGIVIGMVFSVIALILLLFSKDSFK